LKRKTERLPWNWQEIESTPPALQSTTAAAGAPFSSLSSSHGTSQLVEDFDKLIVVP
jgi:hypothetical protein